MQRSVCCWQVDGFSARIKPEPKEVEEEEEEGIGDVDLFSLVDEHTKLTINAKWLQHLQVLTRPQTLLMGGGLTRLPDVTK